MYGCACAEHTSGYDVTSGHVTDVTSCHVMSGNVTSGHVTSGHAQWSDPHRSSTNATLSVPIYYCWCL